MLLLQLFYVCMLRFIILTIKLIFSLCQCQFLAIDQESSEVSMNQVSELLTNHVPLDGFQFELFKLNSKCSQYYHQHSSAFFLWFRSPLNSPKVSSKQDTKPPVKLVIKKETLSPTKNHTVKKTASPLSPTKKPVVKQEPKTPVSIVL